VIELKVNETICLFFSPLLASSFILRCISLHRNHPTWLHNFLRFLNTTCTYEHLFNAGVHCFNSLEENRYNNRKRATTRTRTHRQDVNEENEQKSVNIATEALLYCFPHMSRKRDTYLAKDWCSKLRLRLSLLPPPPTYPSLFHFSTLTPSRLSKWLFTMDT
jgi:hypothetical protein